MLPRPDIWPCFLTLNANHVSDALEVFKVFVCLKWTVKDLIVGCGGLGVLDNASKCQAAKIRTLTTDRSETLPH